MYDPVGQVCMLCVAVYHILGKHLEYPNLKAYEDSVAEDPTRHHPFMEALRSYITKVSTLEPQAWSRRLPEDVCAEIREVAKVVSNQSIGVRISKPKMTFIEIGAYKAEFGTPDPKQVRRVTIAGKQVEGVLVLKDGEKLGHYTVEDYEDRSVSKSMELDDASMQLQENQGQRKFEAAVRGLGQKELQTSTTLAALCAPGSSSSSSMIPPLPPQVTVCEEDDDNDEETLSGSAVLTFLHGGAAADSPEGATKEPPKAPKAKARATTRGPQPRAPRGRGALVLPKTDKQGRAAVDLTQKSRKSQKSNIITQQDVDAARVELHAALVFRDTCDFKLVHEQREFKKSLQEKLKDLRQATARVQNLQQSGEMQGGDVATRELSELDALGSAGKTLCALAVQDKGSALHVESLRSAIAALETAGVQVSFPYKLRLLRWQERLAVQYEEYDKVADLFAEGTAELAAIMAGDVPMVGDSLRNECSGIIEAAVEAGLKAITQNDVATKSGGLARFRRLLAALTSKELFVERAVAGDLGHLRHLFEHDTADFMDVRAAVDAACEEDANGPPHPLLEACVRLPGSKRVVDAAMKHLAIHEGERAFLDTLQKITDVVAGYASEPAAPIPTFVGCSKEEVSTATLASLQGLRAWVREKTEVAGLLKVADSMAGDKNAVLAKRFCDTAETFNKTVIQRVSVYISPAVERASAALGSSGGDGEGEGPKADPDAALYPLKAMWPLSEVFHGWDLATRSLRKVQTLCADWEELKPQLFVLASTDAKAGALYTASQVATAEQFEAFGIATAVCEKFRAAAEVKAQNCKQELERALDMQSQHVMRHVKREPLKDAMGEADLNEAAMVRSEIEALQMWAEAPVPDILRPAIHLNLLLSRGDIMEVGYFG